MLDDQIAEWTESVTDARRELALVELARHRGQPGATLTVAEDEASLMSLVK